MAAGDCRVSRFGIQVLGDRAPRTHATRIYAELLGETPPQSAYVSRYGVQVLGDRPNPRTHFTRIYAELLGDKPGTKTYLSRFGMQVLGDALVIKNTYFTRIYAELLGDKPETKAFLSRFGLQIIGERPPVGTQLSRFAVQLLGKPRFRIQLSRFALQLLGTWGLDVIPNDLPSVLASIMTHNWAVPAVVESAYSTDVTAAAGSMSEERRALVDRPYRMLQVRFTGVNRADVLKLAGIVARLAQQRSTPIPMASDFSKVTAESSGDTIHCDTRYRRFFVGARVLIHGWSAARRPSGVEYAVVQNIAPTALTLTAPLVGTFPAGSRVYPCLEAEIDLGQPAEFDTDSVADATLTIRERVGRSALPSTVDGFVNPSGFGTYLGRPIFDAPHNWSAKLTSGIVRGGGRFQSGRAEITEVTGARGQWYRRLSLTSLSRADFWRVLNFWDSRLGRCRAWWLVDPATLFDPTVLQTTGVRIRPSGNIEDVQDFYDHVAIVKRDGTVYIRGISSVTLDSGDWLLAFDSVIPATDLADVRKVTPAYLVRCESDSLRETWITDEVCQAEITGLEVLEEAAEELAAIAYNPTGPAPAQVADLYLWAAPLRNTWANVGRTAKATTGAEAGDVGASVALWDDVRQTPSTPNLLGASAPGQVIRQDPETNNGQAAIPFVGVGKWNLRPLGDAFYDNAAGKGLTVFMAYRVGTTAGSWPHLLKKTGVLEWGATVCKMFETLDGEVANNNVVHASLMADDLGRTVIAVLRWDPGVSARVYKNGGAPLGSAVTPVVDLPAEATRELDVWPAPTQLDADDVLIYRRALTTQELNKVGAFLAAKYDVPWSAIA